MFEAYASVAGGKQKTIQQFIRDLLSFSKSMHQREYGKADEKLVSVLATRTDRQILIWEDCLNFLRAMNSESVQLMETPPPHYNTREYSQWGSVDAYLSDMLEIITACYRVLDNHRPFVFNVGDIFDNDFRHTRSSWGKRRIPLGAYFTQMFEAVGYHFADDFIWDKGEPQTQRHKNSDTPYPLYQ